ncbi:hypothetical protein [Phenylobacterium sp.]|uniref:hypothetical protein n=1 Tax=Phenylobacterium sp. TaxID=1871053 RepID=UPI00301DC9FD
MQMQLQTRTFGSKEEWRVVQSWARVTGRSLASAVRRLSDEEADGRRIHGYAGNRVYGGSAWRLVTVDGGVVGVINDQFVLQSVETSGERWSDLAADINAGQMLV